MGGSLNFHGITHLVSKSKDFCLTLGSKCFAILHNQKKNMWPVLTSRSDQTCT